MNVALRKTIRKGIQVVSIVRWNNYFQNENNRAAAAKLRDDVKHIRMDKASLKIWVKAEKELKREILTRNPAHFLTWDVVQRMLACSYQPFVKKLLKYLMHESRKTKWAPLLVENKAGTPCVSYVRPSSSDNLITCCYHLAMFEEHTGVPIESFGTITEFGGGYGLMRSTIGKLRTNGYYRIVDLPVARALQRYYWMISDDKASYVWQSPNVNYPEAKNSLFIATFSLSETPLAVRKNNEEAILAHSHFLISFKDDFEGVDNLRYFINDFKTQKRNTEWKLVKNPYIIGSYYLFGKPRGTK